MNTPIKTIQTITTGTALMLSSYSVYSDTAKPPSEEKMNVLFIGIDDLRPEINCYGKSQMITPNIDRLATQGMVFKRAYVQQAICAASRASLLTGCRPDTTGVNFPYTPWFKDKFLPEHKTIPQFFAANGYYTRTLGKIHHGPADEGLTEEHFDSKKAADEYRLPENHQKYMIKKKNGKLKPTPENVKPWEHVEAPDKEYKDGKLTDETIGTIRRAVKSGKPFFIAPGYMKPHLPFVCPRKYYDLYEHDKIQLSPHPKLGPNQDPITIATKTGARKWWKFKNGIDEKNARQLIHSYYACVSYIDAQVGKLLDELKRLKIADKTIIILWSDHGWHLGDHGQWGKATNYELATRTPLIVYSPAMKAKGKECNALVEFVDLYPTLAELTDMDAPDWLEGNSFAPLLDKPGRKWKTAVFSQYPRGKKKEGYSVRTSDWRYTEWRNKKTGKVFFNELYHTEKDPIETKNLATIPEYKDKLIEMKKILDKGWKKALPLGIENHANNPKGDDSFYLKK